MGLPCTLFGHDLADPEIRRDVDRRENAMGVAKNELVAVRREVATCSRCGATEIVSEHTEVMGLGAATVVVTGGQAEEPLENVVVDVELDESVPMELPSPSTDAGGEVEVDLPRVESTVTFTADHDAFPAVSETMSVDEAVEGGVELDLTPQRGALEIESRVGSLRRGGIDVDVSPIDGPATANADPGTVTTDGTGHTRIPDLPVGEYELTANPDLPAVETAETAESATVQADTTTTVTLAVETSLPLAADKRERRAMIRERIEELAAADRDTAIPYYYATVLERVLDLVAAVEAAPERAVENDLDPDAVVDALLEATAEGTAIVADAMSDPGNIRLFRATDSLPDADVAWDGVVDLETFFERIASGAAYERERLRRRIGETDEFLDEMWSEVAETRPASAVHTRLRESMDDLGDDGLTTVARGYVGVCLLDAIESLFEIEPLRRRLDPGSTDGVADADS